MHFEIPCEVYKNTHYIVFMNGSDNSNDFNSSNNNANLGEFSGNGKGVESGIESICDSENDDTSDEEQKNYMLYSLVSNSHPKNNSQTML